MSEAPMLVAGVMSGTSLDGVDAAIVRISGPTAVELLGFAHRPYRPAERRRIEAVLAGDTIQAVARLHASLAEWAAEAVDAALLTTHVRADALGGIVFPGQTVWHEPPLVTLQLGSPAILAERFGVRVVHDLRSRDVAAGGQGAPLVPLADALLFGSTDHSRILLNLGGMGNATWVGRAARLDDVMAGDTGPGMALIDGVARLVDPALPYDRDGLLAGAGTVDAAALADLLADPFLDTPPPRSTGRERYGQEVAAKLHARVPGPDGVRTAVAFTVTTVAGFIERFLPPAPEVVVSGGGTRHPVLMTELAARLNSKGMTLRRFDELFFPAEAKEAVAFALLGWLTLHGQPGTLPAVTGAAGPRIAGSISPA